MNTTLFHAPFHDEQYRDRYTRRLISSDTLITTRRSTDRSLDGRWRYCADPYDTALRSDWFSPEARNDAIPSNHDPDHWPEISVPGTWNLQVPELFLYEGSVVYTRSFDLPTRSDHAPDSIWLRFHGVCYSATVILNGVTVGYHQGGSVPFCVDITNACQPINRLAVIVENRRMRDRVPGLNTDWFNYGGIIRGVEILQLPPTAIRAAQIALVPSGESREIPCEVHTVDPKASGTGMVHIPALGVRADIPITDGKGTVSIPAPKSLELWSPESPVLYRVTITFGDDTIEETVGFRTIERRDQQILLNGEPVFLRGISIHEDTPTGGRTKGVTEIRDELSTAKQLGCNYVRLTHYPHCGEVARMADELGLLVWEEVPVYWGVDFSNPVTLADAVNQMTALVTRDWNRASVIIWSVGNETPDTPDRNLFFRALIACVRRTDPHRLVAAACLVNRQMHEVSDPLAEELDVVGVNEYYGWYSGGPAELRTLLNSGPADRPLVISEFGAGALAGFHGSDTELFTEECQARIYRDQLSIIAGATGLSGLSPWILYDFRSPRRQNRYQNGFNRKGLIAYDRVTKKLAFEVLHAFYQKEHFNDQ